jgi:DNA replication protein DnaC
MTAFLKIDRCRSCRQETPWEWVPPVLLGGRPLAGTGVWRSALVDDICASCAAKIENARQREQCSLTRRERFIRLLGGVKPYRDFRFERYDVTPGNRAAFEQANRFEPSKDNLYLWGPCGVGKTHLAVAVLRRCFARGGSIALVTPFQLIRKLRMKAPEEEQHAIDGFIRVNALVLDDLGVGSDTAYARQSMQEILDGRNFKDRAGLVITSQYSLGGLAQRLNDDTIPSRLAGMCQVIEIRGVDRRLNGSRMR